MYNDQKSGSQSYRIVPGLKGKWQNCSANTGKIQASECVKNHLKTNQTLKIVLLYE